MHILALASLGYRAVAPDVRGYGDTNLADSVGGYTCFHLGGDLIALLDAIAAVQEKVFVVAHDWGAIVAWYLYSFRPDRIKALEPREIEADFAQIGAEKLTKELVANRVPGPLLFPRGKPFGHPPKRKMSSTTLASLRRQVSLEVSIITGT
ncbi:hypothetical protein SLEP1_g35638 [Rubroshorea leprosula]|uniref:AB hydrolase-1 domain-containing protein n=1 Tax=Rubroshorea leprosula TaxID=152421 RepID=A0AAV5KNR5_9ROSI|nr:hypothetical protein SLEP1_g35638 [Rubroshorea leprosula]